MHFGVITFPGSNCDEDMRYVLGQKLGQQVSALWHKDTHLGDVDVVVLPGGFSYGDYLRSGAIAKYSPIMQAVKQFAADGGFVLGVCNGFQILCESGLLPGALMHNKSHKFICKNVELSVASKESPLTADLNTDRTFRIPIAHGEGNFFGSKELLDELESNGQVLFRYCNTEGEATEESNPNGSLNNIAGICNANRNVMGMMPHPERAADLELGNTDGELLFQSLIANVLKSSKTKV